MRLYLVALVTIGSVWQVADAAPNQPTLLKSYKEAVGENSFGTYVQEFLPTKGQLKAVKADMSGTTVVKVKLKSGASAGGDYAYTVSCYVYAGSAFLHMTGVGLGKIGTELEQELKGKASGADTLQPISLKVFAGGGTQSLVMTCDGLKMTKGGDLVTIENVGGKYLGGSVTYTYLPALPKIVLKPH